MPKNTPDNYYQVPQETWDAEKCRKASKYNPKDAFGNRGRPGEIGSHSQVLGGYGTTRFNGGCVRDGEWYQGECHPLPIVAEGYKIVSILSWGWYIVRTDNPGYAEDNAYVETVEVETESQEVSA